MEFALHLETLNDRCLLVQPRVSAQTSIDEKNRLIHLCVQRVQALHLQGVEDIVPAFESLAVFFVSLHDRQSGETILRNMTVENDAIDAREGQPLIIPVIYDGEDLEPVAAMLEMSVEELIKRHVAPVYRVAMIGFAPGFPYFLGMDPALSVPRLGTPRSIVPAGSVAIGGLQTGIYPRQSAGGWRLLGRTDRVLFDPARNSPALLKPGIRVRFERHPQ